MRVMAQICMVMNLDKCIGCHTCSVTCKQTWTSRPGVEYVWFNNVETRPGQGYPRRYEDQERWRGGWKLTARGRLVPKAGGRARRLASLFANPLLPNIRDYYEPWTYDYNALFDTPAGDDFPVAAPRSLISGKRMDNITWSANWDDNLGGMPEHEADDVVLQRIQDKVRMELEQTFMFYLPRICEHCINPSCVASCPSGALYKRLEDGIVLVDQDRCRGWRMCVTGCPYKKMYFNHRTGKAEKCTFCFPRIEVGQPTVCSETCVGRLRYIGVLLYDADRAPAAAATPREQDLYPAQLDLFLNPHDPEVRRAAEAAGIPHDWIQAARRSPVYDLIATYGVALPLHPEYRTLPMVWYVPPLSPVVEAITASGHDGEDHLNLFGAIDTLRIPVSYLAELFTAGDPAPVELALRRLAAMRSHRRRINLGEPVDPEIAASVGFDVEKLDGMFRLLALAKYEERYVIPTTAAGDVRNLEETALSGCSLDYEGGPGMGGTESSGPFGEASGRPAPLSVETFHGLRERQTSEEAAETGGHRGRINLLNWDGRGLPEGLFPYRSKGGDGHRGGRVDKGEGLGAEPGEISERHERGES
ncbi:nitrate reductase subunit beta [Nonomuraea wenchangensis]|uniref:Respiratory nitrate reductase beta subunit n=1 Tax=Nonomuraea wenchangensis TaxID=568860 RepID=A0A1I0LLZ9_9ACTN|nr:nitrate reductase subunit beta [Nonomuraea wenchangensis]SEU41905.1 respiratory nitrate reductase beta subunit [Nonomuraea wenchangensis]